MSWIVAPAGYCEHPSYTPDYGAHYVNTVLQTLFSNPDLWKNTALFITYDEHDGFFDHQLPPFPEASVTDEYIDGLPIGPGTRVPMLICSPWTRGGYVDSNVYDHTSMLEFLATWTGVKPANVTPWRASVTGDLRGDSPWTRTARPRSSHHPRRGPGRHQKGTACLTSLTRWRAS